MYELVKRGLDAIGSVLALVICAPVFALTTILIKLDGGPVFFRQERIGWRGQSFTMLKFRTMVPNAHEMEFDLSRIHAARGGYGAVGRYADPRITRIGAILRLTNLDEIPQFLNILKGDMSLIGPRPVPYEESLFYGRSRTEVLSVRPGLTGYWQVRRRMSTDYSARIALDRYYVRNRGILLDAYILFMTPISMLTSDYNSVTKPLPPPDLLHAERRRVIPEPVARPQRAESLEDAVV